MTKLCVPAGSRNPVYAGGFKSSRPLSTAELRSSPPVSEESITIATALTPLDTPDAVCTVFVIEPRARLAELMIL